LNCFRNSTLNDIKRNYKKLSLLFHPDKGGNSEDFKIIKNAYEILSDFKKRREYDMNLLSNSNNLDGTGSRAQGKVIDIL